MFAIIKNKDADISNLTSNDIEFNYFPRFLKDNNGIQYPFSVLKKYSSEKIFDLFEIYTLENVNNYDENAFDGELQDIIIESISVVDHKIIRTYTTASKTQEIIDEVNEKRTFESSIEYRKLRKESYIREISPEQDPISTLGDVVDALYYAVYHNDSTKLNELAIKIETIKASIPKPS